MVLRRLNKEYKLDVCDSISLKYGTVNRNNPQVVYVSGKCWISPLKKMNYVDTISSIEENFRKNVRSYMADGENFDNRIILDFGINSDKIVFGEKKFLSFDFCLRQNNNKKKQLKDLKDLFTRRMKLITSDLVDDLSNNNFSISKKKS